MRPQILGLRPIEILSASTTNNGSSATFTLDEGASAIYLITSRQCYAILTSVVALKV